MSVFSQLLTVQKYVRPMLRIIYDGHNSCIFLSPMQDAKDILDEAKFKIDDNGCLRLISPHHDSIIVFQFRDDIESNWNLDTPKFDFAYFLETKKEKTEFPAERVSLGKTGGGPPLPEMSVGTQAVIDLLKDTATFYEITGADACGT